MTVTNVNRTSSITQSSSSAPSWICSFHITWITFWFCFFVWFSTTNIQSVLSNDTNLHILTLKDHQIAGGLSITSTILFRIIMAYCMSKYGSRISYIIVLLSTGITLIVLTYMKTKIGYFICHFLLGISGASFVITQYHTSHMVETRVIGFAAAITAGFGNFGGGCANAIMPLLVHYIDISWKTYMYILCVILLILAMVYYFGTYDIFVSVSTAINNRFESQPQSSSDGNNRFESDTENQQIEMDIQSLHDNGSFWETVKDLRVWILFICYAICFGVELTFYLQGAYWFNKQFDFTESVSGILVMVWSSLNLIARPFGGYYCDRYNVQRRVYILFCVLALEGLFTMIFGLSLMFNDSPWSCFYTVSAMLLFSFTVNMAEGVVFSIVPFINRKSKKQTGIIMGIVGSGGNVGAALFIFLLFIPLNFNENMINFGNPWLILGMIVMTTSILSLLIRFKPNEIMNNHLLSMRVMDNLHTPSS